jgi:hypothetical protein
VDWQTVTLGPGASDAAYLVGGGLPVDVRRSAEPALFAQYIDSLRTRGVMVDREACWRAYRINALAGLHMTVIGAMLVGRDGRTDEMFVAMAERHGTHAADLEAFAALDDDS